MIAFLPPSVMPLACSSANKVMWSDRFVTNYSKNIKDRFAWKLNQVGLILRDWSK